MPRPLVLLSQLSPTGYRVLPARSLELGLSFCLCANSYCLSSVSRQLKGVFRPSNRFERPPVASSVDQAAVVPAEVRQMMIDYDRRVKHYEVLG